jgi:hypothetical protein
MIKNKFMIILFGGMDELPLGFEKRVSRLCLG